MANPKTTRHQLQPRPFPQYARNKSSLTRSGRLRSLHQLNLPHLGQTPLETNISHSHQHQRQPRPSNRINLSLSESQRNCAPSQNLVFHSSNSFLGTGLIFSPTGKVTNIALQFLCTKSFVQIFKPMQFPAGISIDLLVWLSCRVSYK